MKSKVWIACLVFVAVIATNAYKVKIGIVSGPGSDRRQNSAKFWSFGQSNSAAIQLDPVVHDIPWWSGLEVARAVCSLAKAGAKGLAVQAPSRLAPLVATYADSLRMPLATAMDVGHLLGSSQVSLLPDTIGAAAALLHDWEWESFGFVYDADTGADQLQKLFELMDPQPRVEPFWRAYTSYGAFAFIQKLPPNITRLLLATSEAMADELFTKLASSSRRMHGVLLKPVGLVRGVTIPSVARLTKFSFVDEDSKLLREFENRWKTLEDWTQRTKDKEFPDSALLNSDISKVFYSILGAVSIDQADALRNDVGSIDCFNYSAGISFKKTAIAVDGVTGSIRFNEDGRRIGYTLRIVESTQYGLKKIATWSDASGLQMSEIAATREPTPIYAAYQRNEPPIRVTSILTSPYLMRNAEGELQGFIADLVEGLRNVTGRRFDIQLVKDGRYGYIVNGRWVGMIGELLRNESDIALSDLTKTAYRAEVVDFGRTFLTNGLNILIKKMTSPEQDATSFGPFSFLTVWSVDMWMVLLLVMAVFAVSCYFISRFIGAPDRVRALESKGTDNLSPCGSFWFTVGALFQRDTGIYPRTFTHRLWAILWWTFCFFIMVSYISALTAALIQTRRIVTGTHSRKSSHEVLQDLMTKGSPAIGSLRSGATVQFFKNSNIGLYRDFGHYLSDNPDVLCNSLAEGVTRVQQSDGSYAFIMESLSSEFVTNLDPCDTLVSSGYLSTRAFAPAMRKNSTIRDMLDRGILTLIEDGTIRKLYEKWWHLSTHCEDPNMDSLQNVYSRSMKLHEVSGIFYILCLGAVLSLAATLIDHYLSSKRVSLD